MSSQPLFSHGPGSLAPPVHDDHASDGPSAPRARQPRARRGDRGYDYTDEERERRLRRMDSVGRRCHGHKVELPSLDEAIADYDGVCFVNSANRRITLVELDPDTKAPKAGAREFDVVVCSRHKKFWELSAKYRVVRVERLEPLSSFPV